MFLIFEQYLLANLSARKYLQPIKFQVRDMNMNLPTYVYTIQYYNLQVLLLPSLIYSPDTSADWQFLLLLNSNYEQVRLYRSLLQSTQYFRNKIAIDDTCEDIP